MKFRLAALLAASLLLSGCSDELNLSNLLNFPGDDEAKPDAPVAAVATAAPAQGPNAFCMSVARHAATGNDFDTPTQQHMAQQNYAQCLIVFGGN